VLQSEQAGVVTKGPWLGRDGFVAETAVQFDRVNATIARLEREMEKSRQALAEMAEESNRARRFQAFEETLKNSRDYKITDMQRGYRDLKSRLDAIEGDKSTFVGLTYKSFDAIDKKLAELAALQAQFEKSERNVRRNAMLLAAAAVVAVIAVAAHFV
jgi:chromosome segregation ATPase